jgi:hypothetical protein
MYYYSKDLSYRKTYRPILERIGDSCPASGMKWISLRRQWPRTDPGFQGRGATPADFPHPWTQSGTIDFKRSDGAN